MKNTVLSLLLLVLLGVSCKDKKDDAPTPAPAPQKGEIRFAVLTYDSLGRPKKTPSGLEVSLVETGLKKKCDSLAKVAFENLPYQYHTPVILRSGYEGPLTTVDLKSAVQEVTLPVAQQTEYKILSLSGSAYSSSEVYISFTMNPVVPPGDTVKVAIISSSTKDLSPTRYAKSDIVTITSTKVTDLNLTLLPNFNSLLMSIPTGSNIYVAALPASYGLYKSNMQAAQQVLGDNPYFPGALPLKVAWTK